MPARPRLALLAAGLVTASLLPLAFPAAADAGPVALPLPALGDLVLDETHRHLFASGGKDGDGVRVLGLDGAPVAALALPGATGMALTDDGSTLWVAVPAQGLVPVDTSTLAVGNALPTPGACPGDVVVSGGRLVYGFSCNRYLPAGGGYGGIGVLDAVTGASYGTLATGPFYEPRVATGPAGQAYAADAGLSPATLSLYDVSGTAPVLLAERAQACSNLRDLTARPGGAQVVTACGASYQHQVWSAVKLEPAGTYASGAYPSAGAWSGDGRTFAAGLDSAYEPDVYVHREGLAEPARIVDFGSTSDLLVPRGLAVSADGLRVWAVSRTPDRGLLLRVLDLPSPTASTITLGAQPSPLYAGGTTTVSGRLLSGGSPAPAGVPLDVVREGAGAAPVALPPVTTGADGTFAFTDTPPAAGTYGYTAVNPADHARATVNVLVWSTEPRLAVKAAQEGSGAAGAVVLSYDGSTSPAGRSLSLTRSATGTADVALAPLTTDAQGYAAFRDSPGPGTWTYTARVAAAGVHPAGTATATVTVRTPTTLTVSTAAAAVEAGTPVVLSGRLATASGAPVAGADVEVGRLGCTTSSWTATTGADGTWSVTDPGPPVGSCGYVASYAGSPEHAPSSARLSVTVTLRATSLTAGVGTAAPVARDPLAVQGRLVSGGRGLASARVLVVRSGCGSTGWQASVLTAGDGAWSVSDPLPPGGTCTYRASYAGSAVHASSAASASTTVALRDPSLGLSLVRGTGSTKKLVHVTGSLGAVGTNRTLTLTAQPSGGAEVTLASGPVGATGTLTASHQPRTTTTYRVRYSGDEWYAAGVVQRVL